MTRQADADAPRAASAPEATAPAGDFRLAGLEPDNLLAFLALLGLLRALDTARPNWKARAHWDIDTHPVRPVLTLREAVTRAELLEALVEGVDRLAEVFDFGGRNNVDYTREEARAELEAASPQQAEVLAALMSDVVLNDKGKVMPTPYCFLFGQGHQHFLDRLSRVPALRAPPPRGKGKSKLVVSASDCLAEALMEPWRREDATEGFRWDPAEDRRYALRAEDPSSDTVTLQHGANRLAAVALPILSGAAMLWRGKLRFFARATSYQSGGTIAVTWPLWHRPARLASIRALLAHPLFRNEEVAGTDLAELGAVHAMRAERIPVGQFMNITVAMRID